MDPFFVDYSRSFKNGAEIRYAADAAADESALLRSFVRTIRHFAHFASDCGAGRIYTYVSIEILTISTFDPQFCTSNYNNRGTRLQVIASVYKRLTSNVLNTVLDQTDVWENSGHVHHSLFFHSPAPDPLSTHRKVLFWEVSQIPSECVPSRAYMFILTHDLHVVVSLPDLSGSREDVSQSACSEFPCARILFLQKFGFIF
jgi:hypothetical protein